MKKILALSIAMATLVLGVSAQGKSGQSNNKARHERKQHGRKQEMMKELDLSDAQKAQMKANREEYKKQMQALKQDQNITVKEMNLRKSEIKKQQKAKMESILTPQQKLKIAELKSKKHAEGNQRYESKLAEMKSKLSLTDDQVNRLKSQREKTQAQMKSIRENESLDQAARKEQMMALKNTSKEQMKNILTPDQMKKMEEFKKNHEGKERKRSKR